MLSKSELHQCTKENNILIFKMRLFQELGGLYLVKQRQNQLIFHVLYWPNNIPKRSVEHLEIPRHYIRFPEGLNSSRGRQARIRHKPASSDVMPYPVFWSEAPLPIGKQNINETPSLYVRYKAESSKPYENWGFHKVQNSYFSIQCFKTLCISEELSSSIFKALVYLLLFFF